MKVAYKIVANGEDVTGAFSDRLVSLTITDEAGGASDTAEIKLDDRDYALALPPEGAELEISIGFEGNLTLMGRYVVDEFSGDVFPAMLTIKAKAANMLGGIRDRKTRSWEKASVQDIVEKIAGEHGLKPVVGDSVKSAFFEYLAQTSESDLHFLTRLAKDLDAVAKPAGGALVFMARGEGKAADGSALPVTTVFQHEIDTGSWSLPQRGKYGRVIAEWGDKGAGSLNTVTAGDEKPELKLRHPYATKDEAQRAAKAALKKSQRTGGKLKIQMGGFYPDMMAEAFVNLPDIKPELRGEWLMARVEHQLEDSLTTSFNAERGNEGAKA